jgi:NADPH:quinone reductase-like Zn-dependent oxidoreductase
MMRRIGADHVIDYTTEDFTTGEATYDVIFDVVGKLSPRRMFLKLKPGGRLILANPTFPAMIRGSHTRKDGVRVIVGVSGTSSREQNRAALR